MARAWHRSGGAGRAEATREAAQRGVARRLTYDVRPGIVVQAPLDDDATFVHLSRLEVSGGFHVRAFG